MDGTRVVTIRAWQSRIAYLRGVPAEQRCRSEDSTVHLIGPSSVDEVPVARDLSESTTQCMQGFPRW